MKTFLSRFLPVLLWIGVIFAFSARSDPYASLPTAWGEPQVSTTPVPAGTPAKTLPSTDELIGRFLHVGEYLMLGFLVLRAVSWNAAVRVGNFLVSAGLSLLYALSDEIHQIYVPGRAFQVSDLLLDLTGILIGLGIYYFVNRNQNGKQRI
jgi:VanZ family protein